MKKLVLAVTLLLAITGIGFAQTAPAAKPAANTETAKAETKHSKKSHEQKKKASAEKAGAEKKN